MNVEELNRSGTRRKSGGVRPALLLLSLAALLGLYIFSQGPRDGADSIPDWSSLEANDSVPSADEILRYLDGKSVPLPEPAAPPGPGGHSIVLKKELIRSLSIAHEDLFSTLATFEVVADQGRIAFEVSINHHPIDGTFIFGEHRVVTSKRR